MAMIFKESHSLQWITLIIIQKTPILIRGHQVTGYNACLNCQMMCSGVRQCIENTCHSRHWHFCALVMDTNILHYSTEGSS